MGPFHDAIKPVVEKLYANVKCGNEAQISIDSNSKPDYREKLEAELKALRESEMWQTAVTVRKLRPGEQLIQSLILIYQQKRRVTYEWLAFLCVIRCGYSLFS